MIIVENNIYSIIPGFLLNSVPKSGTHLMKQILQGMPNIKRDVTKEFYEGLRHQDQLNFTKLSQIQPNSFAAGHIYYSREWADMLRDLKLKHIFIYRDLRDIVISYTNYIIGKFQNHPLKDYMTHDLTSQKERYLTLIRGIKDDRFQYPNIQEWYMLFHGWIADSNTLTVTFEDLMRSPKSRQQTLMRIAQYVWSDDTPPISMKKMIQRMESNINPEQSLTFHSGKIGNWKIEFDPEVKAVFKEIAGDVLIKTKYEKSFDW